MKHTSTFNKWKWNGIMLIGGLLIGAGVTDCIFATNTLDLNQIARGLTIFSAGLTIIVVLDSNKTQKETEIKQKETQLKLSKLEELLLKIQQTQKISAAQHEEIIKILHKSDR